MISTHFTWFEGYARQMAHCASCVIRLGWLFHGPDDAFAGLIVERFGEHEGASGGRSS